MINAIIQLKNKTAIDIIPLDHNDKRLSKISFIADWGDYYEVKFPHTGNRFSLVFENSLYGKEKLNFSKVAKFVYTKKGF